MLYGLIRGLYHLLFVYCLYNIDIFKFNFEKKRFTNIPKCQNLKDDIYSYAKPQIFFNKCKAVQQRLEILWFKV